MDWRIYLVFKFLADVDFEGRVRWTWRLHRFSSPCCGLHFRATVCLCCALSFFTVLLCLLHFFCQKKRFRPSPQQSCIVFVHVKRDVRLLVHGCDFMWRCSRTRKNGAKVEMRCKSEKFHSDGNTLTKHRFVNHVIRWDPASGRAEWEADMKHFAMVLRDLGLKSHLQL